MRQYGKNELGKNDSHMITMKGKLITLEPLDIEKHAKGYFVVSQDESIHKYAGNDVPKDLDEIITLLKKYENYFINWMILSNETHNVIGLIRLGKPAIENGMLVAGESQFLSSQYWRKGHMKEAKKLFYQYVFDNRHPDVHLTGNTHRFVAGNFPLGPADFQCTHNLSLL